MSIGRQDYEERKEARIDRIEQRAASAAHRSDEAFRRSGALVEHIPLGQPIQPGQRGAGHRKTLERSRQLMSKCVEEDKKAAYYESKAQAARNNSAISGDDPDALEKLRHKLEALEAQQEQDKALNAWYRKHETCKGFQGMSDDQAAKLDAALAEQDASPYSTHKHPPVPAFVLSNRNAEINRLKKRLAQLQQVDEMDHVEIPFDGGLLTTNEEINRVQILFDAAPDEATRSALKAYGFRWSPGESAWQAQRTPKALRRAKHILGIPEDKPQPETDPEPETPEGQQFLPLDQ